MDLPTCPACGQSVLDDDVEECPFCGASMSGKPAAGGAKAATKAAPARPATASASQSAPAAKSAPSSKGTAAGRPTAASTPARTTATKETAKADDDPFAVDESAHARAIPLQPQPAKGRRHAVKCPMCETVGYTSTKAAGREVRCANPKCLVPVFTAPAIEKPPEPEAEAPKPRFTTGMLAGISGVALVIIGVCLWLFVFSEEEAPPSAPLGQGQPMVTPGPATATNGETETEPGNADTESTANDTRRAPPPIPPAELRQRAFESMLEASREGNQNRRSLSVRLMAEAYAATGHIDGAYEQLNRLPNIRPVTPYYAIPPLVEVAWQHLANDRRSEAETALAAALKLKGAIAQLSQDPWNAAVSLAALMAAFDRDRDAAGLLRDRDREEERAPGVLWTQMRAAHAYGSYDIDEVTANSPLKPWKNPPFVAVVLELGAHRQFAAAQRWASAREDLEEQADGLAAWAESLVRSSPEGEAVADPLGQVRQAVDNLSPPLQAFVLARMAFRQAAEGDQAAADKTLQAARETLADVKVPADDLLPEQSPAGLRTILSIQPGNSARFELAAIAAAEAARVAARLERTDEAWQLVEQALGYARGMGPNRASVTPWLDLMKNRNSLDYQLGLALDTTSTDRKRIAFNEYRSIVEQLARKGDARLHLQATLLSRAIEWGLADRVLQLVEESSASAMADPYLRTTVPWLLAAHYRDAGAAEQAQAVTALLQQNQIQPSLRVRVEQDMARLVREGKLTEAANVAQRWPVSDGARDETDRNRSILRLAARLVKDGKTRAAFQWLQAFRQPAFITLRQEGFALLGALATRRGDAQTVWRVAKGGSLEPVERAATLRGMIVALDQVPPAEPPAAEAAPAADR